MGRKAELASRVENKWQMVLRNIPGLKKCGSQKGRSKKTLAKSDIDNLARESFRTGMRAQLWYQGYE